MIEFLRGRLVVKKPSHIIIEVNGIAYGVEIPFSVYSEIGEEGEEVKLHTYLYLRENIIQLYGFSRESQRRMFAKLLSVSGIGPRKALGILSRITPEEFEEMLIHSPDDISSLPGIGKKMGQKIMLELKGEIISAPPENEMAKEAVNALIRLGATGKQARELIRKVRKELPNLTSLEDTIREALKRL